MGKMRACGMRAIAGVQFRTTETKPNPNPNSDRTNPTYLLTLPSDGLRPYTRIRAGPHFTICPSDTQSTHVDSDEQELQPRA